MGDQPIGDTTTYTTHNKHETNNHGIRNQHPAIKWLQTYALDCTAIGIGTSTVYFENNRGEEHIIPLVIYIYIYIYVNPFIHCSWFPIWFAGNSN